jgi:4-hydroxyproline epimerase
MSDFIPSQQAVGSQVAGTFPMPWRHEIRVIDSHTGGEPTRVVIEGGPDLGGDSMAERRVRFRDEFDEFRSAIVNEPRGSDVIVGALLSPPVDPFCVAGVLFFNNVGPLWMCGHGTIGLAVTLGHLGRIGAGTHRLETAVGLVTFEYDGGHRVSFENVPSYRFAKNVAIDVPGLGQVVGDIAWGGNWFFLVEASRLPRDVEGNSTLNIPLPFGLPQIEHLTDIAWRIRQTLVHNGITGADCGEIDHIELFGPPGDPKNHSRNFVLCPGRAYDRSPCGTGTSAKLACLYADGKLKPGEVWRQESILGSVFEGSIRIDGEKIIPRVAGTAYVTAEATLLLDPNDPMRMGIRN